ncbi:MAG: hypothetical protein IJL58_05335 [Bacteroidales bacterium]|nr:hypothetical protein [Bacteroidales bacterium]
MAKTGKPILVRLLSVKELAFSMNHSLIKEDETAVLFNFGFQITPAVEREEITVFLKVTISSLSHQTLLDLDSSYDFSVPDLGSLIHIKDNGETEIESIPAHLLNVAVGTARGLIVSKTAGTPLSKFPLPIVDIPKMLSEAKKS